MSEVSQKQLEANRENAKLGGVKTEDGKAVSRFNAVKHGLLSQEVCIKGESQADSEELGKALRVEFKPANEMEMILVERIIANTWRLKRALRGEKEMIECNMQGEKTFGSALSYDFANYDRYGKFTRYETCLERGIYRALHELQRLQAARLGEKIPAPVVVDLDVSKE